MTAPTGALAAPTRPRRLRAGDTVSVVAPAGNWHQRSDLHRGIAELESWGLRVKLGQHVNDRHGYFAGTDEDRAADVNAAFADPETQAVLAMRGGYGCQRIVPLLDRDVITGSGKLFGGYSDITTLHLLFAAWGSPISFYCVNASGTGAAATTDYSRRSMRQALMGEAVPEPIGAAPDDGYVRTLVGGVARGRLSGGCLTLVHRTLGTSYEIDTRGTILFLEDVDVEAYQVDGMLTHLRDAGKLDEVGGIVISDFEGGHSGELQELSLEDVLEEVLQPLGVPLIYGLPLGHGKHHATVPIGAEAILDADAGVLRFEEPVTRD
jgi:muramoyltetrapeptide carboxypeptidase